MSDKLSRPTILFHWATGLLFLTIMGIGLYMEEMAGGPDKFELIKLHKSLGVIIIIIALTRIFWRFHEGQIKPVSRMPFWQEKAAKFIHWILLTATIAMPVSGIMMSIGGGHDVAVFGNVIISANEKIGWLNELGESIHEGAVPILFASLGLHILGALKHQFIDKDRTISRMLGS
ncbi:cytochrome b [Curvivirga aplysinae]|uniref:cytochrome b n=1 Tax=Curvivirga aplysinae TaxID=2529852 RepID=UPI0012BC7B64|nr:cytochrome b [Curvivirga aplysinae]MTI08997.1 cytochrome b [Curvivirga aplysinae]